MDYSELLPIKQSIENYEKAIKKVLLEETTTREIKPLLGGMGVYEQREKGTFMLRIRIPAGILKVHELKVINEIANQYNVKALHLTSRQAIQYHGVSLEDTFNIMKDLLANNLITVGSGGNNPRNIACSPLTGVEKEEAFDVSSYALASYKHIIKNIDTYNLPRKYKVAFSSTPDDTANATVTDLGFMAFKENNEEYFRVYVGGGLGRDAKKGIILEEKIPAKDALYYIQGTKELFEAEGDRDNRYKARLRYVVERLGEDKFKEYLKKYVDNVRASQNLDLKVTKQEIIKQGKITNKTHRHLYSQKQPGLYSVYVHPKRGYIDLKSVSKILNLVEEIDKVEIRLTMNQGFYIINLNGEEANYILEEIDKLRLDELLFEITVCTGSSVCQIGLADTEALIDSIYERFKNVPFDIQNALPHIYISGCLNSCGTHQIADIGLCGKRKKVDGVTKDAYTIFYGGKKGLEDTKLGEPVEDVLGEDIPEMLYKKAKELAESIQ